MWSYIPARHHELAVRTSVRIRYRFSGSYQGIASASAMPQPPPINRAFKALRCPSHRGLCADGAVHGTAEGLPVRHGWGSTSALRIGFALLAGRTLNAQDLQNQKSRNVFPVAVINESFARRFFGRQNPIGQSFRVDQDAPGTEIVGVVGDAKYDHLRSDVQPTIYVPIVYIPVLNDAGTFVIRTAMDPKALMPEIRTAASRFDSNLLIKDMKTQMEQINQNIYQERLIANLSSLFALLALIVACVGIYGLLSYQVSRRTYEIGIRLALGAQRSDVLNLVMWQGAILAVLGALIGIAAALALTRYLQSFLFGVKPSDPVTIAAVAIGLIAVALLASYIPARRAMKTDPMVALRYE
jgi:predicted permease